MCNIWYHCFIHPKVTHICFKAVNCDFFNIWSCLCEMSSSRFSHILKQYFIPCPKALSTKNVKILKGGSCIYIPPAAICGGTNLLQSEHEKPWLLTAVEQAFLVFSEKIVQLTPAEKLFSSFAEMKKIWAWLTHLWVGVSQTSPWPPEYNTKCLNERQKWCHLLFVAILGCFLAEFWGDAEMRIHCKAVYFVFSAAQELNWKYFSSRWCAGSIGHYCKSNLTINPIYLISQSHLMLGFTITNVGKFSNWSSTEKCQLRQLFIGIDGTVQQNTNCLVSRLL